MTQKQGQSSLNRMKLDPALSWFFNDCGRMHMCRSKCVCSHHRATSLCVCVSGCNIKTERKREGGRYVEGGELGGLDNCLAKNKPHLTQFVYRALIMSPEWCIVGHAETAAGKCQHCIDQTSQQQCGNDWLISIKLHCDRQWQVLRASHGVISISRERGKVGRCSNRWEHKKRRDKRESETRYS